MKNIKRLPLILFALLLLLTAVAGVLFARSTPAAYAYDYDYGYDYDYDYDYGNGHDFEFTHFYATYDIRADRTMDVCLDLEVKYIARYITGFYHDIPVNDGDRVRNISATEIIDGQESSLYYDVNSEEQNFITMVIGDDRVKTGQTRRYILKYEYAITKPADKNAVYLNAIGFGSEAPMNDVLVTLNLPEGFVGARCWSGPKGVTGYEVTDFSINGDTVTYETVYLRKKTGVTFQLDFKEGVLSTKPDLTPYWVVIGACAVLALLFAVKFLLFNKDGLTPVTNVEAPDDMDPLVMGKLIDNKVNKPDVTSLIYYWANKGYLKIDLKDKDGKDGDDIEFIRIRKSLPQGSPAYQIKMYDRLFNGKDVVKLSDLACSFYGTIESVTKQVNAENSKLYSGKSMAFAVLFAIIGGLIMALTPIILTFTQISSKLFLFGPIFMIVPALIIFALTQTVRYNRLKFKKGKMFLLYAGIALLAAAFSAVYVWLLPSYYIELVPKILLCAVGFATVMLSTCIISRTEAYTEKLNHIVGFRDFILLTEKDKLETMLESNPELYYQVLPYAIVLGVSDVWENKFSSLTIAPPKWTTRSYADDIFDIMIFNSLMRRANMRMTSTFISRPASSPSSMSFSGGGSHGGHFGGFSGGGHGGGGFRGKF
ncbi:MAG: DUF2207 domain-containing protein [Roseburia sp.]|nr:DUF2207 domain-containing protein [Roseburia sp.]